MNKFTTMVAETRPVETFIGNAIDAIADRAADLGYVCRYQIHHVPRIDHIGDVPAIVTFQLFDNKTGQSYEASFQISTDPISSKSRIHAPQGFPPAFGDTLHNLSKNAVVREDTSGAQAIREDDPAAGVGRDGLVQEPDQATNAQVCSAVVSSIDLATVRRELLKAEPVRRYIGASGIGDDCMAYHSLCLRGFPGDMAEPQLLRIFEQGNAIEDQVVKALRSAGHDVHETDPSTGKQWSYRSHGGHHAANLDGLITLLGSSELMTLEIKSMNRKMFETFEKKGVQLSHPKYYDQCTDGLHLVRKTGTLIQRCLLVAYCKDNSRYAVEIIEYDQKHAESLILKVDLAVVGGVSKRESDNRHAYKCKGCFKRTSCWEPNVPDEIRSCSHCRFSFPIVSGERTDKAWMCCVTSSEATSLCPSFQLFKPEVSK